MEVKAAEILWKRSIKNCGMLYVSILSEGDTKIYQHLSSLNVYGNCIKIAKEECTNHVAKRLGTGLRNKISEWRNRGITIGGRTLRIRAHYEQLSEFEKGLIIGLKEASRANRRIARHMGRSDAAIRRCWQEWLDNGRFQCHDGSGQPRATADREDRLIVRSAVTISDSSLSTVSQATTRTRVCNTTIHRQLMEQNLRSYRPLHHLPLTPAHCRARLQWCLALSGWNPAEGGFIVFSEESRFQMCPDDHRKRVCRPPGQCDDPAFTISRHTGPSTKSYGLNRHFFWSSLELEKHFQGQSDLSLIEHVWDMMGRRLYLLWNIDDLARQLEQIWQEIPQVTIGVLYHSMPRHVTACIQARGGLTPY
ncbi:HTH_Tnp_Tc3_2 domain-containing protein [Trichonephila clavipes]|nr:HTH_Tnp_Tc3_2 domain-containing protein [Trichonephila clavipes]